MFVCVFVCRSWQEKLRESEQRKREELDQLRVSGCGSKVWSDTGLLVDGASCA